MIGLLREMFGRAAVPALLYPLIRIACILLFGVLLMRLIDSALKRVRSIVTHGGAIRTARLDQRAETLRHIVRSVSRIALGIIMVLWIAPELGFKIEALLAGAGIAGLAIGFGAQSLVKDVISGFFILLEDQYGVGDVVRIGQQDGVVEDMSLRVTRLRNLEGHVHVIPNGNIQTVTVLTKDWSRAVIDVTVSQREDLDRVFELLRRVAASLATDWPDRVLEKPQVLGIERLSDEGVTIRSMVKTPPAQQADVLREWRRRIKDAFDKQGIQIPGKVMLLVSDEPKRPAVGVERGK
jgi:moderate conductance mechanosensitive channel